MGGLDGLVIPHVLSYLHGSLLQAYLSETIYHRRTVRASVCCALTTCVMWYGLVDYLSVCCLGRRPCLVDIRVALHVGLCRLAMDMHRGSVASTRSASQLNIYPPHVRLQLERLGACVQCSTGACRARQSGIRRIGIVKKCRVCGFS